MTTRRRDGAICHVMHGIPSGPRWLVTCNACDDFFFAMPIRTAPRHDLAVAWAHQHARRHLDAKCPCCGHMGRIDDATTRVDLTPQESP